MEIFFGIITRQAIRRGTFGAVRELIEAITATAEMAGLNPITYLTAYLDACGRTGGKPPTGPNLERFLPWAATPDDLHAWKQPPRPG